MHLSKDLKMKSSSIHDRPSISKERGVYHLKTQGRRTCEDGGRDWSDASAAEENQGLPAATIRQNRGVNSFFLRTSRRNRPCQHLDFGLVASRTVREQAAAVRPQETRTGAHLNKPNGQRRDRETSVRVWTTVD